MVSGTTASSPFATALSSCEVVPALPCLGSGGEEGCLGCSGGVGLGIGGGMHAVAGVSGLFDIVPLVIVVDTPGCVGGLCLIGYDAASCVAWG